jgi:polysaccharide deacetylase family protein (PEP-CTERM system associated)
VRRRELQVEIRMEGRECVGSSAFAITGAMTVDVEDYFQVAAFVDQVGRADWDSLPCRVERNLDSILAMFSDSGVMATFFTLGWIAERYPKAIRSIVENGHELASHGYEHVKIHQQQPHAFREDVQKTKAILEDVAGARVKGYRAASFSIDERSLWAFDVLAEAGYEYSSSTYPIKHDHYGMPNGSRFAYYPSALHPLLEVPISTLTLFDRNIPSGGGGYFRLLPYGISRWALRRIVERDRKPVVFYFHPWEIDPEQPRVKGISLRSRFRHYVNLRSMEQRLRAVLKDFHWDRMDRVFLRVPTVEDAA